MHPRLCTLLQVAMPPSKSADNLYLLSIPLPRSSSDPILLTLVTTFLIHSLTTISHLMSTPGGTITALTAFMHALNKTPTLLAWSPLLLTLPPAHTDSILTRAYSCLIKVANVFQSNPKTARQVFLTRDYALACLAQTAPGKIQPRSFWDQVVKSAGTYAKSLGSAPEEHDDATPTVLNAFAQVVTRVQSRVDADTFMSGKGFISFCECWMSFANRVRYSIFGSRRPETF